MRYQNLTTFFLSSSTASVGEGEREGGVKWRKVRKKQNRRIYIFRSPCIIKKGDTELRRLDNGEKGLF
jgi:hypothetical protein